MVTPKEGGYVAMDTIINHSALEYNTEQGGMPKSPKALRILWMSNSPWAT